MAFELLVASPQFALKEPFASQLTNRLRAQFGGAIALGSDIQRVKRCIGWSGWKELQDNAESSCGKEELTHLLSVDLPAGCYLPVKTEVGSFEVPDDSHNLDFGSLEKLIDELELVGMVLELPTDDKSLTELFEKYYHDEDLIDDDMDIQTFALLLPMARFALQNQLPLWVFVT